jgi:hypothetical protein
LCETAANIKRRGARPPISPAIRRCDLTRHRCVAVRLPTVGVEALRYRGPARRAP